MNPITYLQKRQRKNSVARKHNKQVIMTGDEGRYVQKNPYVDFQFDAGNPQLTITMWMSNYKGKKRIFFATEHGEEIIVEQDPNRKNSGYLVLKRKRKEKNK